MTKNKGIKIYLIRHGEAAKAWNENPDPGLSLKGKKEAQLVAKKLVPQLSSTNFQVLSSPLLRAQETIIPLQQKIDFTIEIQPAFAEIPSPGIALIERRAWLKGIFNKNINELEKPQLNWRNNILTTFQVLDKPTLVFSHFMTINCIVGSLLKSQKVVSFYPNTCSVTIIEKRGDKFKVLELGQRLETIVQ